MIKKWDGVWNYVPQDREKVARMREEKYIQDFGGET
jgi:hypothetical protein